MAFVFDRDAIYEDVSKKIKRTNATFGIDISHWEGTNVDILSCRDLQVSFVYVKATQGIGLKDDTFAHYWKALADVDAAHRPLRGAFHFISAVDDPAEQAARFVQYVNLHGGSGEGDLPLCLDLEWDVTRKEPRDKWTDVPAKEIVRRALMCLNKVKELTKRAPMLYTCRGFWLDRGIPEGDFAQFSDFYVWMADYGKADKKLEKPAIINNRPQDLWQFTDSAKFSGTNLDASIFYGSLDDLKKRFHITK